MALYYTIMALFSLFLLFSQIQRSALEENCIMPQQRAKEKQEEQKQVEQ